MIMHDTFLVVWTGDKQVGLAVSSLVEVLDMVPPVMVPSTTPALRGVIAIRDGMVPVFHLGAALDEADCPEDLGAMAVLATVGGKRICVEVDHAAEVVTGDVRPLPDDFDVPGAVGVVHREGHFIPIIDLEALGPRLTESE